MTTMDKEIVKVLRETLENTAVEQTPSGYRNQLLSEAKEIMARRVEWLSGLFPDIDVREVASNKMKDIFDRDINRIELFFRGDVRWLTFPKIRDGVETNMHIAGFDACEEFSYNR